MHIQLIVRGVKTEVEKWEAFASSQFFKWRRINKATEQEEIIFQQAGLRQSVLGTYEYIVPKEALAEALAMFGFYNSDEPHSYMGKVLTKVRLATLRKIIGLRKVKKKEFYKTETEVSGAFSHIERAFVQCVFRGVTAHLIGVKDDPIGEMYDPNTGKTFIQEML